LNGAAVGIAPEQRPLRATQHLDALDLDEAALEKTYVVEVDPST
jgi:hypothetical protein